jgi:hypothetical protein
MRNETDLYSWQLSPCAPPTYSITNDVCPSAKAVANLAPRSSVENPKAQRPNRTLPSETSPPSCGRAPRLAHCTRRRHRTRGLWRMQQSLRAFPRQGPQQGCRKQHHRRPRMRRRGRVSSLLAPPPRSTARPIPNPKSHASPTVVARPPIIRMQAVEIISTAWALLWPSAFTEF